MQKERTNRLECFVWNGEELTARALLEFINRHRAQNKERNFAYYEGRTSVHKGDTPEGRPDNQANSNLAKYIVDTATGYFMGSPVTYKFDEDRIEKVIRRVLDKNDEQTINYDIAESMSIAGVGYDLVYIDPAGEIRIAAVDPRSAFVIRSGGVEKEILAGVRYWLEGYVLHGELYLAGKTRQFEEQGGSLLFVKDIPTPFSQPNLTEYPNNRFFMGDFEPVMDNIDAYNLTLSNVTDDLQSIANAYLVLSGMEKPDEEALEVLRTERVLGLPVDGGAAYITKNLNDSAIENHKKTLREDILQIAGVPNLSDQDFSQNASGVALRYKLWGIDQLFAKKSRFMDKGLFRRLRLIGDALDVLQNVRVGDLAKTVTISFTRNMPKDMETEVDTAIKLQGVVSRRTLLELLEPATGISALDETLRIEMGTDE